MGQFRFVDEPQVAPPTNAEGRLPYLDAMNIEPPTPIERVGRGVADFTEGAQQAALWIKDQIQGTNDAEKFTQERSDDLRLYERGRGQDAGVDWWRATGNVASAAPVMLIPGAQTLGGQMLAGGAIGGTTAGAMFTPEGKSKAGQVAIGAATGAAAPVVAEVASKAINASVDAVKNVVGESARRVTQMVPGAKGRFGAEVSDLVQQSGVDWIKLPDSVRAAMLKDAEAQFRQTGRIDTAALLRKQAIEEVVGPGMGTTAQITRNPAAWTRERNLQKVTESEASRRLTERYQQQDAGMQQFSGKISKATGAKPSTPFRASEDVISGVTKVWKQSGDEVSAAYDLGRKAFGAQADMPTGEFSKQVTSALDSFSDVMPEPITRRLAEFGFSRMGPVQPTKAFTVEEGDKLLKLVNMRYTNGKDAATDAALNQVRDALKGAMMELSNTGNESAASFREAWKAAADRFRQFDPKPLADIVGGKADSSRFMERYVLGGNPKDIAALARTIQQAPEGTQQWNTMRGQVWDWIMDQATSQGRGAFSGAAFDRALNKVGEDRLRVLFPDVMPQIDTLRRAASAMTTEPAFAAPNRSNTAATLANWMLRYGPDIPVLGPMAAKPIQSIAQNVQASDALMGNVVDTAAQRAASQARAEDFARMLRGMLMGGGAAAASKPAR